MKQVTLKLWPECPRCKARLDTSQMRSSEGDVTCKCGEKLYYFRYEGYQVNRRSRVK